ncbi:MAG TPA: Sir2 family NAD-dependent protein deacetylase [Phycisphaerae bacterium]|jgi:NAD-dependent deacetylase|nr:NAD-dependent protein deacylase [Phycisphaerae bacterium]HOB73784.1 Sir2 family NAD-dependent protein deacetylase [Phycisphaerae bacterium]HOJ56232.1 Sir2 family NAD-dependent protein deacetylase [Phycisphaerae bacterium]HOL27120.1 Sir2 family NAD-dependent protein deacetylase [Phycisphaerae bacterium]HPP21252.1 Sir2 family NAD-dependent protein deacetylase [Phycisphaerae bacterium]
MADPITWIAGHLINARQAVAFTGAGISTESGIPDFRSPGGVWTRYQPVYYDEFLDDHEARVRYWRMKRAGYADFAHALPNVGHRLLAQWEAAGRLKGVITQNIDGLHRDAGSRNVLELHGTQRLVECISCEHREDASRHFEISPESDEVPRCPNCRDWLKPAVVMFGQPMPEDVLQEAWRLAGEADLFLAIGSSLVVEPAASLPVEAKRCGSALVIINRDPTPLDRIADVVLRRPIGESLVTIDEEMCRILQRPATSL